MDFLYRVSSVGCLYVKELKCRSVHQLNFDTVKPMTPYGPPKMGYISFLTIAHWCNGKKI